MISETRCRLIAAAEVRHIRIICGSFRYLVHVFPYLLMYLFCSTYRILFIGVSLRNCRNSTWHFPFPFVKLSEQRVFFGRYTSHFFVNLCAIFRNRVRVSREEWVLTR